MQSHLKGRIFNFIARVYEFIFNLLALLDEESNRFYLLNCKGTLLNEDGELVVEDYGGNGLVEVFDFFLILEIQLRELLLVVILSFRDVEVVGDGFLVEFGNFGNSGGGMIVSL